MLPVNADDLKRVWYLVQRIAMYQTAEVGAQSVGIAAPLIAEKCEAGADVIAVFFRAVLLQHVFQAGLLDDWRDGNEPADPVFRAGAIFQMEQGI